MIKHLGESIKVWTLRSLANNGMGDPLNGLLYLHKFKAVGDPCGR